jgi:uncharacterized damage-inducible protein DinB
MEHLREVYRQVWTGADFDDPDKLLRSVKPDQAAVKLEGWPYSIGTNVAHADHWNKIWLARLTGNRAPKTFPDFPAVAADEWAQVRADFLENFAKAKDMANAEPFSHSMKSDEIASKLLLQIAIHTTYHLGQVKLLKRLLRGAAE